MTERLPFTFYFHALEKEMATHSSILAWRIPWTEEPGGLQSMGLQRDRQDCATNTFTFTFIGNIFNRERLNAFLMLVNKAVISNPHHFFCPRVACQCNKVDKRN